jgi:hypothetical protein
LQTSFRTSCMLKMMTKRRRKNRDGIPWLLCLPAAFLLIMLRQRSNETEQSITFPNSLEERKCLFLKDNSAQVGLAERQPHFSCVLDSVTRRLLMPSPWLHTSLSKV